MEKEERRRALAEECVAEEVHGPVDPHRFERLFQEAQAKREEQQRRTEDFYRQMLPQHGPKQLSDEVKERLLKPKEKSVAVEDLLIRPERSTMWDNIPIAQIRTACEQEGLDTKGKTKEELLEFLKQLKHRQPPKAVPKATFRQNKLYMDHQRQLRALEEKRKEAAAKEEREIEELQMKPQRAVRKNLHERLYADAEAAEKRRQDEVDKATAKAEEQLLQPSKVPAKMETFLRLHVDGHDKLSNLSEKKRQLEMAEDRELQEASVHKNKTADPGVFNRLYNGQKRGEEALDQDDESDEEELPAHLLEATYDTVWMKKGAPRPPQEELKGLLKRKVETVENAQRRSITSANDGVHAGLIKRGPNSSSSSSLSVPARDATPVRNTTGPKKQAQVPGAEVKLAAENRKVTFKRDSHDLSRADCLTSEAGLLRDFAKFFFGCLPTVDAFLDAVDMNKTGRINMASFIGGMKRLRYQGDAKSVFRALDIDNTGYLGKRELSLVNKFHPHLRLDVDAPVSAGKAVGKSKAAAGQPSRLQQKSRSSSTPSLAMPIEREEPCPPPALPQQQSGEGYPYKGRTRMTRNASASAVAEAVHTQPPPSRLPVPNRAPTRAASSASSVSMSELRAAQLAECSGYNYKGRSNDAMSMPMAEKPSKIPAPSIDVQKQAKSRAGKGTPGFGPLGQSKKLKASPMVAGRDARNRASDAALVCDDELLDVREGSDTSSESSSSSTSSSDSESESFCSSRPSTVPCEQATLSQATLSGLKPNAGAALVCTESSTASRCSTPRSVDTESMPWQEVPRSSSASSASGAPCSSASGAPWMEGITSSDWRGKHALKAASEATTDADSEDLQAEVRQLLLQYKLDNERVRPEAGCTQHRQTKEACGPELSCRSAWIHPDKRVAQQT
jgi:hypothetical protein